MGMLLGFRGIIVISTESVFMSGSLTVSGITYVLLAATGIAISKIF
ncbi:MAG: hypothetical protein ACI9OH_001681 [Oleispira sp.]|jgi:hypothetical protein